MNPYEWTFGNPDLFTLYLALALLLVAWIYWSFRKLFKWCVSVNAAVEGGRSEGFLLPDDVTGDVVGILLVTAVDLVLIGAYLHVVTA